MSGIMMGTFMSASAPVQILVRNPYDIDYSGSATATSTFNSTGTWSTVANTNSTGFTWLLSGAASAYDIQFQLISGSTPTGLTELTWYNLGTTRTLSVTTTNPGYITSTFNWRIRRASDSAILTGWVQHSITAEAK